MPFQIVKSNRRLPPVDVLVRFKTEGSVLTRRTPDTHEPAKNTPYSRKRNDRVRDRLDEPQPEDELFEPDDLFKLFSDSDEEGSFTRFNPQAGTIRLDESFSQAVLRLIEEKKKSGLFLSVIGTGFWNYQDDKLEVLSKHGNGTYCVANSLPDVTESIDRHYTALTNIIAKDVKAQLEFNPCFVKSYRLLGYENRELAHEDFVDDAVISEPYGSGGHGVALYELEMGGAAQAGLKYQTAVPTGSDELCTVKIRYKEPLADASHELQAVVFDRNTATRNAELARLLYCVSEELRCLDKLDEADEQFLARMLPGGKYKELSGKDTEKLTLFVESMNLNGSYRK